MGRPGSSDNPYLIDGSNVCYWNSPSGSGEPPALLPLLTLFDTLDQRGLSYLCCVDANLRYRLTPADATTLQTLLARCQSICGEAPGRTRADLFLLQRASAGEGMIITNDRFREHLPQYPWAASGDRLIKGTVIGNNLQIESLSICVPLDRSIDTLREQILSRHGRNRENEPSPKPKAPKTDSAAPPQPSLVRTPALPRNAAWRMRMLKPAILIVLLTLASLLWGSAIQAKVATLIWGSKARTEIVRREATSAFQRLRKIDRRDGFESRLSEAQWLWRDAEISFRQGEFRESESRYQRFLEHCDSIFKTEEERATARQVMQQLAKARTVAMKAGAPDQTADHWRAADELKKQAEAAWQKGDFRAAYQLGLQAQKVYQDAATEIASRPLPSLGDPNSKAETENQDDKTVPGRPRLVAIDTPSS